MGLLKPNDLGLFDMHGNLWEWCADKSVKELFGPFNPVAESNREPRAIQGGAWGDEASYCRSRVRLSQEMADGVYLLGFRVAASLPGPNDKAGQ